MELTEDARAGVTVVTARGHLDGTMIDVHPELSAALAAMA
jgi:hypothetical protein